MQLKMKKCLRQQRKQNAKCLRQQRKKNAKCCNYKLEQNAKQLDKTISIFNMYKNFVNK